MPDSFKRKPLDLNDRELAYIHALVWEAAHLPKPGAAPPFTLLQRLEDELAKRGFVAHEFVQRS